METTFSLPKSQTIPSTEIEEPFIQQLENKLSSQTKLYGIFIGLLFLETIAAIVFFPFFIQSAFFAFMIALLVLTFFGFLLFRQYSREEKRNYFESLVEHLVHDAKAAGYQPGNPDSHLKISRLCSKLADKLYQKEYRCLPLPKKFPYAAHLFSALSCSLYWRDVLYIRELLLQRGVDEHLELVRAHPANLDAHTMLANAYVMLSGLYAPPEGEGEDKWTPAERYGEEAQGKFRQAAVKAIEEFKILKDYAPKDPWIYSQLAFSYKDLKMPDEEKAAYEMILELKPNDHETRHKLGSLYFKRGENAKGLKVYDELKRAQHPRADELLSIYGKAES